MKYCYRRPLTLRCFPLIGFLLYFTLSVGCILGEYEGPKILPPIFVIITILCLIVVIYFSETVIITLEYIAIRKWFRLKKIVYNEIKYSSITDIGVFIVSNFSSLSFKKGKFSDFDKIRNDLEMYLPYSAKTKIITIPLKIVTKPITFYLIWIFLGICSLAYCVATIIQGFQKIGVFPITFLIIGILLLIFIYQLLIHIIQKAESYIFEKNMIKIGKYENERIYSSEDIAYIKLQKKIIAIIVMIVANRKYRISELDTDYYLPDLYSFLKNNYFEQN